MSARKSVVVNAVAAAGALLTSARQLTDAATPKLVQNVLVVANVHFKSRQNVAFMKIRRGLCAVQQRLRGVKNGAGHKVHQCHAGDCLVVRAMALWGLEVGDNRLLRLPLPCPNSLQLDLMHCYFRATLDRK